MSQQELGSASRERPLIKWLICGLVGFIVWFLLRELPGNQATVGAVFAFTVAMWMSEVLPLGFTAVLGTSLLVLVAGVDEKKAFVGFSEPTIPLFIGTFILSKALETSGLSQRLAHSLIKKPFATRSGGALIFVLGGVACLISLLVSNTATTAMLLPVGLSALRALKIDERGVPYSVGLLLMLTWGSSVAVGFPVGTPPNLIGMAQIEKATGTQITFMQWMAFAMPITVLMLIACWIVLRLLYRKGEPADFSAAARSAAEIEDSGPMTSAERVTLFAFVFALFLWILPDTLGNFLGQKHAIAAWVKDHITPTITAILSATILFIVPINTKKERVMNWATAKSIDWGTILLFAGGISLGVAMFESELAKSLGNMAVDATGVHSLWGITALGIASAIILSELASNTAAATTLLPVIISIAQGAGVSPIAPALGTAIGASLGFMLPVSTAPNALVYSSGLIPPKQMIRSGFFIDIIGFFVILLCLYIILPLLGLA